MEKFKHIVKQLVLSFIVVLSIYSCQKDDAVPLASQTQQSEHSTTKSVSASEIPKVMQFLQSKSNNRLEFLVDDSNSELGMNRSHEENLNMTNTLTEHIKMATNNYGKSNYTFELIEQGDKTGVYFINLVVKEYRDELYMYIIKYVPDATWLQTHHISRDFNVFTGHLYFYSADGTYIGKTTMTNGTATSSFQKHPCEGETGETETTDNSNSSSGSNDGSGGGAIGSDCYVYLEWYECNGDNSDEEHSSEECGGSSGTGSGWTLVIVCEEGIRSMRDALRHPCDGGSTIGGGTNTNTSSCETITGTTCNDVGEVLMEWDDNCNCVESQTIENSDVVVNTDLTMLKSDCRVLNDLADSPSFYQRMQELINNNSGNTEIGYWGRNDNDDSMFYDNNDRFESQPNQMELTPLLPTQSIDSYIHNHSFTTTVDSNGQTVINRPFSTFSPADFYTLYLLFDNNLITDADNFVMVMTSPGLSSNNPDDDTVYAVAISNPSDFEDFGSLYLRDIEVVENLFYDQDVVPNSSVSLQERKLALVLRDHNLGLTLYRGDKNDLSSWTQLKIKNDGSLKESTCN